MWNYQTSLNFCGLQNNQTLIIVILILSFNFHSRFGFQISLAEQDFFTNLGFIHPELFHILPCTFNKQESIQVRSRGDLTTNNDYDHDNDNDNDDDNDNDNDNDNNDNDNDNDNSSCWDRKEIDGAFGVEKSIQW